MVHLTVTGTQCMVCAFLLSSPAGKNKGSHKRKHTCSRSRMYPIASSLAKYSVRPIPESGACVVARKEDIILGRGIRLDCDHSGNLAMHKVVDRYAPLSAAGRAFVRCQEDGKCYIASHRTAKSKIAHAMRYRLKVNLNKAKGDKLSTIDDEVDLFTDEELKSVMGPFGFFSFGMDYKAVIDLDVLAQQWISLEESDVTTQHQGQYTYPID
eukprot:scaffold1684_cov214-Amphora_coffeaeformis.AAC.14